ncbi:hypothetical protein ACQ4M4_09760 [Leptolyngbya sp. AN02str]|uniref:hypothetical protein n=1 Tax=Leptolyngbya sp. AN02str TaxID=3423363 RepID=UPI003D314933
MTTHTWKSLPNWFATIALIGGTGLLATGCSNLATPSSQASSPQSSNSGAIALQTQHPEIKDAAAQELGLQENMPYEEARSQLLEQGWQPNPHGDAPNLNDSTVRELVDLGYEEVKDCSGTGLGPCRLEFINAAGDVLAVSTIQNGSDSNRERVVWGWSIEAGAHPSSQHASSQADTPPFFGTRYYSFYGGSGTSQSITFEFDGSTTVELHGTQGNSILYRGSFANPIPLTQGERLQVEVDRVFLVSENGEVLRGCSDENTICEAELYEPTASPLIQDGFYALGGTGQGLEIVGDRYRYYDESGEGDWAAVSELTSIQDGVVFDGQNYWCSLSEGGTGVCTENGWRSVEERLREQGDL